MPDPAQEDWTAGTTTGANGHATRGEIPPSRLNRRRGRRRLSACPRPADDPRLILDLFANKTGCGVSLCQLSNGYEVGSGMSGAPIASTNDTGRAQLEDQPDRAGLGPPVLAPGRFARPCTGESGRSARDLGTWTRGGVPAAAHVT